MAWELKGQLIENCSCNMFCPCWFGVPELMVMDRGWCAGGIALRVQDGSSDGVDLSGRSVVIRVHFPGPTMFDGNGTARIIVDDGATNGQRDALEAITQGRKGGPMEAIAPLFSSWMPTASMPIEIDEDGDEVTVSLGAGAGEIKSKLLRDPEGNDFTLRGGGFVMGFGLEQAELAPSDATLTDSELPEETVEMRSGARGDFAWAG
jgi:hypothetical protein